MFAVSCLLFSVIWLSTNEFGQKVAIVSSLGVVHKALFVLFCSQPGYIE